MLDKYQSQGFYLVRNVINDANVHGLIKALNTFEKEPNQYGVRNLMSRLPCIALLAKSPAILSLAKSIIGERARPVRAVFFDKLPCANWNVAWHQDTSIVVNKKVNMPGFRAWRERDGVMHVEPPEKYLESIVTLRIHLDPATTETGVLRVVPKTQKKGRVCSQQILEIVEKSEVEECVAYPGDILLMNPLLFHSSRKSIKPSHRRVIHLEYSSLTLPEPLQWFEGGALN